MTDHGEKKISDYLVNEDCTGCDFMDQPFFVLGDELVAASVSPRAVQTQLTDGPGIFGYYPASKRYGTESTVAAMRHVGSIWARRRAMPRIGVGDISLKGGGDIPGHASHETGRDVDLRPIKKNDGEGPTTWHNPDYSRELTRELVDLLYSNGVVQVNLCLFNDPQVEGTSYYANHDNHLHVRFHFDDERPGYPIVKMGMTNSPPVRELQRRLNNWARDNGVAERIGVDGDFGQRTDEMVRKFQHAHNVGVDGVVGKDSWPLTEGFVV